MCVTDRCGAKQNNNIVIRIDMKKRLTLTFWGMLVAFSVMAEAVYDEDSEEDYRETYGDIYPYDWYEDYLMDVRDEIDADQRETCVKLIRYLLENQVDGCIDWGHIDFQ